MSGEPLYQGLKTGGQLVAWGRAMLPENSRALCRSKRQIATI